VSSVYDFSPEASALRNVARRWLLVNLCTRSSPTHRALICLWYLTRPYSLLLERVSLISDIVGTQEFLFKHNIHVVALSPEYDRADDKFYAGARELGSFPPTLSPDVIKCDNQLARRHHQGAATH